MIIPDTDGNRQGGLDAVQTDEQQATAPALPDQKIQPRLVDTRRIDCMRAFDGGSRRLVRVFSGIHRIRGYSRRLMAGAYINWR